MKKDMKLGFGGGMLVAVACIAIFAVVAGVMTGYISVSPEDGGWGPAPTLQPVVVPVESTITLTVVPLDIYNKGTRVAAPIMWRKQGTDAWTSTEATTTTGASITTVSYGDVLDIVIGLNETIDDVVPYGDILTYTVTNKPQQTLNTYVYNDALATDLTDHFYNEAGTADAAINTSTAGATYDLSISFKCSYQEAFGNPYCGAYPNTLVLYYNTTQVDIGETEIANIEIGGRVIPGSEIKVAPVPSGLGLAATNAGTKGWWVPALKSSEKMEIFYHLDSDDTEPINTSNGPALTFYLYDGSHYLDNDDNTIMCGIIDEDDAAIGAAAADTIAPLIADN